jgi:hypothetical protein
MQLLFSQESHGFFNRHHIKSVPLIMTRKRRNMQQLSELELRVLEQPKVSCQDIEEVFGDYVDGELTSTLMRRVDEHIAACEECQEFRDTYLLTIKLARQLKPRPMSEDVKMRLRQALNERLGLQLELGKN